MPVAWRIVKTKLAANAFNGEGARRSGGRWNSAGTPMVYTSATIALALLEVFVHLEDVNVLPHFSVLPVEFDAAQVIELDPSTLPANWRAPMSPYELQQVGDAWVQSQKSMVLRVPSVIVPSESNYLINPGHPDFASLKPGAPHPIEFDPRLFVQGRRARL